jgi:hypothetical protein
MGAFGEELAARKGKEKIKKTNRTQKGWVWNPI